MVQFILFAVLVGVYFASSQENYYCANVNVAINGGISTTSQGYFSMKIGEGYSKYAFNVDLSSVPSTTCDFSVYPNVAYHIHSDAVATGCADANGHYDPTLACSEKSEEHLTYCTQLTRTSTDGYVYSCSAPAGGITTYSTPTGTCEVGDLSGKLGKVALSTSNLYTAISSTVYTDYMPPYNANYGVGTAGITSGWKSIVFHCGDAPGTRIACGNFMVTSGTDSAVPCSFDDASSWVQNESCSDDSDDNMNMSKEAGATILAFFVIGWVLAIGLFVWVCFCRTGGAESASMMSNRA